MVNLTYGVNEILVSASENVTNPNFTDFSGGFFGIYSQVTKQTKWVQVVNDYDYFPRCDNFTIEVVNNPNEEDLENGVVYLKENGFYEYSIWTNYNNENAPTTNDTLLERGKCLLEFNEATLSTYNPDIEIIVYDRQ
jgi:hypothetical protein